MSWPILTLFGASGLAFAVGMLTGIFGVGGGFLMTPGLMVLLSVPGCTAVGTDLAMILTNSSFALRKRRGTRTMDTKLAITMSGGTVMGVLLGSHVLRLIQQASPITLWGRQHNAVELTLLSLFCVLLIWIGLYIAYDCRRSGRENGLKRAGLLSRVPIPPRTRFRSIGGAELSLPVVIGVGMGIGSLTGLLGIGGGVVLLPALIYLVGQDAKEAVGTSLIMVWIASFVGVIHKGMAGHISLLLWFAMIVGGLAGTYVGTKIGLKVASEKLKIGFMAVVLLAFFMVAWRLYGMLLA